jgi:4-hydroxy-tetrahydrodipicolinate reductase
MEKILIFGSNGRMGQAIIQGFKDLNLSLNLDIYSVDKDDEYPNENFDLMIDFSSIDGVLEHLEFAKDKKSAFLTGVTGFSEEQEKKIKSYSSNIPILLDYNMSIGINTITSLLTQLKSKLEGYDIEILETHHKHKKDAPSGTAKKLFNELNKNNRLKEVNGRVGESLREENEVGIHAIRGGGVFGEHTIRFIGEFEEVSVSHRALSRITFVGGVIKGGLWLMNQKKGFYNMLDYLNS